MLVVGVRACNLGIWEMEAEGSGIQRHLLPPSELEISLHETLSPVPKKSKQKPQTGVSDVRVCNPGTQKAEAGDCCRPTSAT